MGSRDAAPGVDALGTLFHAFDAYFDQRDRKIARLVAEELRGGDPSLVDQSRSVLGRRRHVAAVQRRLAADPQEPGASIVGKRHLLTQEALAEELGRITERGGLRKTRVTDDAVPSEAESAIDRAFARGRR